MDQQQPPSGVVDADFEEQPAGSVRPCLGVIEVPIEAIDGTPAVGAALQVRGKGDGFVVLALGGQSVQVRADHLDTALQSLQMLVRANVEQLVARRGPPFGGPPFDGPGFITGDPHPGFRPRGPRRVP